MRAWYAPAILAISSSALAQVRPEAGEGDPRLQTVRFDPEQVVQLQVSSGYQLMVAFAPGEQIETIAVGDSAAWQVTAGKRGDFLFIKNVQAASPTNMTVVSDARVYSFELLPSGGYGGELSYAVRFIYPAVSAVNPAAADAKPTSFKISGARAIRPSAVFQLGNRTFIEWLPDQALPAIFAVSNRKEALVNGEMRDGSFVIVGTPAKLIFRTDRQVATAVRRRNRGTGQ